MDANFLMESAMVDVDDRLVSAVKNKPGIFATEIADRIDVEVCEIMPSMEAAIKAGIIKHHRRLQPNGIMGDSFTLGKSATDDVLNLVPTFLKQPKLSKVDAAVSLMQANGGSATLDDLKVVMELGSKQYPSQWLSHLVKSKKIHATDEGYALGPEPDDGPRIGRPPKKVPVQVTIPAPKVAKSEPKPEPAKAVRADPAPASQDIGGTITGETMVLRLTSETAIREIETLEAETETEQESNFACAVWNDGDVSLVRDGETLTTLSESEASVLFKFLRKTVGD